MTHHSRPSQLSFDLPVRRALGREDFFVSPANAMAVAMIENAESWPGGKLVLNGEVGSGKTHLAHVWSSLSGARIVAADTLAETAVADLAQGSVAVENVPEIAGDAAAQNALFHLHNLVLAEGHRLLITGRGNPKAWNLSLPDLQSRVMGTSRVTLEPPDDALLSAVLAKLFSDRQITPRADVIPYLITRMDRSFAAAQTVVDRLDKAALTEGRTLSRRLAVQLLTKKTADPKPQTGP